MKNKVIIFGAGPAGITAGHELSKNNIGVTIIDRCDVVGGISRTEKMDGGLFDIGGHRFLTKNKEITEIWNNTLGDDFLERPRKSRIFYDKMFFNYPLDVKNVLMNFSPLKSLGLVVSFLVARTRFLCFKVKDITFDDWIINRFGKKLFKTFFKSYTEKLWGISTGRLSSEWASQRIRGLSFFSAIKDAILKPRNNKIKTLVKKFHYPKYGSGTMYHEMSKKICGNFGNIKLESYIYKVNHSNNKVESVEIKRNGKREVLMGDEFISTIPINKLVYKLNPLPKREIIKFAENLRFRSFILVAIVVNVKDVFDDNWVYIHDPDVSMIRISNFKNWSNDMINDNNRSLLGVEYVCWEGDEVWNRSDDEMKEIAISELCGIGFVSKDDIDNCRVVRVSDAYPVYDVNFKHNVKRLLEYFDEFKNFQTIGRAGRFQYNNMDQSMVDGIVAARKIINKKNAKNTC